MITHVAIKYAGKLYSLPAPNRHHHIIRMIYDETGQPVDSNEQGFLDDEGCFLTRKQALVVAIANEQVLDVSKIRGNILFSEDVW